MRYTRMRFDIWLCLLLAYLAGMGTAKLTGLVVPSLYQRHVEEHTVADGDIGGKAGAEVFRAQSVADLLSHDTFTILSDGIEYCNRGGGYYGQPLYERRHPALRRAGGRRHQFRQRAKRGGLFFRREHPARGPGGV